MGGRRGAAGRADTLQDQTTTAGFLPGLELARLYYEEAVGPILRAQYPQLQHSAGLMGPGSEVLGFDDEMSTDHNWGTRVVVFLSQVDYDRMASDLRDMLARKLPFTFHGHPTHFEAVPDDPGSLFPKLTRRRPINHRVEITTLPRFTRRHLGLAPGQGLSIVDWLTIPEQTLRSLVTGAVYHDGLHLLEPMRRKLHYYPHDVWLYLLSSQWQRIGQEEAFVGRSGIVGDTVGSALIASRLVRDLMRLCFLMERTYAPYSKWFGSAFAQLDFAPRLEPVLKAVLVSNNWQERERHLSAAYEAVVKMHNDLAITKPMPVQVSQFHGRPFMVIQGETIARAIWETITDEGVRALPYGVGKVDQYVDSTDVLSNVVRCRQLSHLYVRPLS
jgi:hypothetical protein